MKPKSAKIWKFLPSYAVWPISDVWRPGAVKLERLRYQTVN